MKKINKKSLLITIAIILGVIGTVGISLISPIGQMILIGLYSITFVLCVVAVIYIVVDELTK
jgi:energy-converting hydrogenase Eha subunit C